MGYISIQFNKVKGSADTGASDHIERKTLPKNANPTRTCLNRELVDFPDGVTNRTEAINHRIRTAGIKRKITPDQVRAIRIVLSGTHEDMMKVQDEGRLNEWCADNLQWLHRTFGRENTVSAVLHMDEHTPHIHATVVPIVTGERRKAKKKQQVEGKRTYRKKTDAIRLCADDVLTREKLTAYHDSYAEAMAKHGLQRGIRGSEARHITTAQYYRDLKRQTGELEVNVQQLQTERQQAEQKLDEVKKEIRSEKLEAAKTEAKAALVAKVGSFLGGGKLKAEREGFQQRIAELENQNARLEQHIKQMEREHQAQCSKFSEYMDKVKRYFPHVEKLLPLIDFCRNTLHFSEQIIQELCKLKKVNLKGDFYSPEFNRKFHAEGAAFSFEEDKSRTGRFHICVNNIPLVQWFRQKAHEWRNGLGLTTPKQGNRMKI
ncbi:MULTISPECIES: MobV family relaxase [Bacteroidales]|jgi:outer membrane murein-binding lipoprotein Lpp|uniref:MobV family relaxase n=1 Tax=Bacteroidales TaxID=171549 RepID=UPI001434AEF0|nr:MULTISPECIES: MobV family relaxase [Bacteroidales]MBV4242397.1 plasmid recombination protein [Parabacteroides johnsonii]MCX4293679.1 plasmid recombination protein [Prevotella sp.]NPD54872.1 mobilization protein [Prevotella sp. PTAC]GFH98768.1 plasmid recombination enzyme [Bacteroidaceae bacterium]